MIRALRVALPALALVLAAVAMRPVVDTVAAQEWSNPLTWSAEVDAREQGVAPVKPTPRGATRVRGAKPLVDPLFVLAAQPPALVGLYAGQTTGAATFFVISRAGERLLYAPPRGPPGAEAEPRRAFASGVLLEFPKRA